MKKMILVMALAVMQAGCGFTLFSYDTEWENIGNAVPVAGARGIGEEAIAIDVIAAILNAPNAIAAAKAIELGTLGDPPAILALENGGKPVKIKQSKRLFVFWSGKDKPK